MLMNINCSCKVFLLAFFFFFEAKFFMLQYNDYFEWVYYNLTMDYFSRLAFQS